MFAASKTASSSAAAAYQISRSLRFNSADSAYLNRTPASASNRTTWTYSGWVKRSKLGTTQDIFTGNAGASNANFLQLIFITDDTFWINGWTTPWRKTSQVFRDVSAWYHIVVVWDTTQATAANRVKLYVNGTQVTAFSSSADPALNDTTGVNAASTHYISTYNASSEFYDGYMTEVNFIDGQALTPSSFGQTDAQTGVWTPIAYSGSYGTNGFYLNFSDNSNTTAATLGKDYSGNGNNWTPNNFSVTAGVGNDSLVDSPTSYGTDTGAGGTVRGNYCTLNPLFIPKSGGVIAAISNGNLDAATNNSKVAFGTMQIPSTGKWYFEFTCNTFQYASYGIGTASAIGGGNYDFMFGFYQQGSNLEFHSNNYSLTGTSSGIVSQSGDIALVCVDMDNGKIWMGRDRSGTVTWSGGGTPAVSSPTWSAAGQGGVFATNFDTTLGWFPLVSSGGTDTWSCNFGQRPFAYTAPSGFKALCTQNLPTPTIGATTATQAGKYFNPVLYTGNGTGQSITGVGFQPDWTWIKSRSNALSNGLYDAVRGVQKQIISDSTAAETTETTGLTSFDSDGFTTGLLLQLNTITATYVAWNWKANGSGSTNTAGSITSTVSASATSGFSIVTYSGQSAAGTIGHGLGVAPSWIIVKNRSSASPGAWTVYSSVLGNTSLMFMNTSDAVYTGNSAWNSTSPTSSVFSVGPSSLSVNTVGNNFVAYCFAEVAGFSKFGQYTGNASTDGPFVYCGFRPAYIMVKGTASNGYNWLVFDSTRDPYNLSVYKLFPNLSDAESGNNTLATVDLVSNGFKIRSSNNQINDNYLSGQYIFMAFASNPFKYSLAR